MIATSHPVAPEDLMALLDGELTAEEAQSVSAHLDHCAECASLAQQFRAVSQSLSTWTVPAAPPALKETVLTQATQAAASARSDRTTPLVFWNWKTLAFGGAAAAAIVLAVGSFLFTSKPAQIVSERQMTEPQANPQSIAAPAMATPKPQVAMAEQREMNSLAAMDSRVAKDSNGLFQGAAVMALPSPPMPNQASFATGASARIKGKGIAASTGNAASFAPAPPMIARTVSLSIVVRDFSAARGALDSIIARHQGYSAQLSVTTEQNAQRTLQDSLRIPTSQLTGALAELKSLGRVEYETQTGEEVTQQHADLAARLQNSRETEQRLRDILAQRTGKIEDVLQVEEEIARVRGEIERMEAEQQALEHRVDFATIDLHLTEEYKEQFNSTTPSASTQMRNAFISGMRSAAATLLGLVLFIEEAGPVILIWLLILAGPAILLWRRFRRLHASA